LAVGLVCILFGITVSILGIWGYIGDTGLVWCPLSTLAAVLLGLVPALVVNSFTNTKAK
jgi:hypothetical protein